MNVPFLQMFALSPVPMLILSRDGRNIHYANPAACQLYGRSQDELMLNPISTLSINGTTEIKEGVDLYWHLAQAGEPRALKIHTSPLQDADNHLVSIIYDITEQMRSEQRWRFTLENSKEGVFDWNLSSGTLYFSDHTKQLLGIPADCSIRVENDWVQFIHPADIELRRRSIERYHRGETPVYTCQYRYKASCCHWKWVEVRGSIAEYDAAGKPTRMVGIFSDVDEEKRRRHRDLTRSQTMDMVSNDLPLEDLVANLANNLMQCNPDLRFAILTTEESGLLRVASAPGLPSSLCSYAFHFSGTLAPCGEGFLNGELRTIPIQEGFFASILGEIQKEGGLEACWVEPIQSSNKADALEGVLLAFRTPGDHSALADIEELSQAAALLGLAIARRKITEQLQLASSVYEASSDAILVADAENRIVAINPAFTRMTGYTLEEVRGLDPRLLRSTKHDVDFFQNMWDSLVTTGSWQGEIWNQRKDGEIFVSWMTINTIHNERGEVSHRTSIFSDISERKRVEDRVWVQANYDTLTQLPNRRLFHDRLRNDVKKAERGDHFGALMFIDLDRFKEVNDTLGHEAGDILLVEASRRITSCVRESDTVARLGGDEFTIMLSGIRDPMVVERIARDILSKLNAPFSIKKETVFISGSIGITMYPKDACDVETLFKNADQAMYAAKDDGRNGYSWYTDEMQIAANVRNSMARDLRFALKEDQMELYFQPIIDMRTFRIVKVEALLRWNHPEKGLISPQVFIPIAESNGAINELGNWVFQRAVKVAKHLYDQRKELTCDGNPIQVVINKSQKQFYSGNTATEWRRYMESEGLPPSCLGIEIMEGVLLDNRQGTMNTLKELRDFGVEVAIDDFGTGYSAMANLQKFKIDYLKIDKSFVGNLVTSESDRAIAEGIIAMGHKLGMQVVAEGIETQAQCNVMLEAGCDFGQGYFFAKPLSLRDLEAFLWASKKNGAAHMLEPA